MSESTAVVMPKSGYEMNHIMTKGAGTKLDFKITVTPKAATVNGYSSAAGSGVGGTETVSFEAVKP